MYSKNIYFKSWYYYDKITVIIVIINYHHVYLSFLTHVMHVTQPETRPGAWVFCKSLTLKPEKDKRKNQRNEVRKKNINKKKHKV